MALNEQKKEEWNNSLITLGLMDGEDEILEQSYADYWKKCLFFKNQVKGNLFFTKKRFIFCSAFGKDNLSFLYSDIKAAKPCQVGALIGLLPTGLKITAFDSDKSKEENYVISIMKRKQWLELFNERSGLA